ncbi:SoxR reducing system RseC family protein [Salipiger abyssi]|uniref:SoxR reducing system RseC family protein n=1 Tax=Salipiger abyssi TaxID=1250539 RepID=UPI001A8FAD85|nr:SoxR reducing system RseC family protein [Salipiger abyssi]MBN9887930.1 SoxR reducing system RseC family protein [Salipiger abyssi]
MSAAPESETADCTDDRSLRQVMRVVAVDGDQLRLEGRRATACAQCAARSGCGAGALAELAGSASLRLTLPAPQMLRPGDAVVVALPATRFLAAAGLAYLLPPAALAATAVLARASGLSDGAAALLCLPVLALSLWPLRRAERRGRVLSALRVERVLPAGEIS